MRPQPLISVNDVPRSSLWYRQLLGCESAHGGEEYERLVHRGTLVLQLHDFDVEHHHGRIGDPSCDPTGTALLVSITGGLPDDYGWGPLSLEEDLCVFSGGELLAPGDTCQIFVRFSPTEFFAGRRQNGTLQVTASDPSTLAILETTVIPVTGTGR